MTRNINVIEKPTFCRLCEPHCPLIATIDAGRVVGLRPNEADPIGGTACHKGLSYLEVHRDPDRLNYPMKRLNMKSEQQGQFERMGWDAILAEIGKRINDIREEHGPNAIAIYLGNPLFFNGSAPGMAYRLQSALGSLTLFTANSQDAASRVAAFQYMYGSPASMSIPDIYNTDYLLCMGANPRVSKWTGMCSPNDPEVLKNIKKRGGKIRFVNPRKTESSTEETGPTLQIKPDTDVYFLAAILHELHRTSSFRYESLEGRVKNLDDAIRFVAPYSPAKVSRVTGLTADEITQIAKEISDASSACIYASLGLTQGRQGILSNWLVQVINLVTGNVGRKGGIIKPAALIDACSPIKALHKLETSIGTFEMPEPIGYASLPGAVLADLIEGGDIHALIILGGNPLLSIGGEERMRQAFGKLDLMLTVDIFPSATADLSDYVLPATDWLERPDINLLGDGLRSFPHVRYTEAMTKPAFERKNDWWILARLIQEIDEDSPLDDHPDDTEGDVSVNQMLAARNLSIEQMLAEPSGVKILPAEAAESIFERTIAHPDGLIDCFPEEFRKAHLERRCEIFFRELEGEPSDTLLLISRRSHLMHNSWFSNIKRFTVGREGVNPLHICSSDAKKYDLFEGDRVLVSSQYGAVETQIFISDELRPGTVAMTHGSGHGRAFGLKSARKNAGENYNKLVPTGPGSYEPLSNMSWLNGVPVSVKRIEEHRSFI